VIVQEAVTASFEALFHAFYPQLSRLLYRITGNRTQAEEVASEAFWRLHRKPPPADTNVEGWLYRTGLRIAFDRMKADRRRARYEALASVFGFVKSPHHALEENQDRKRLRLTLAVLKPHQAALILLRADGLSYTEIATALGLNANSVGTLLARANEAFRKEYVKRHGQY